MTSAAKTLEEDIQALRGDVAALAESISQLLKGAAEATAAGRGGADAGMHGAAQAGQDFMSDASKLKTDSVRAAEEALNGASSLIAGEIRRNPFVAIAAALCIGFVAGFSQRR